MTNQYLPFHGTFRVQGGFVMVEQQARALAGVLGGSVARDRTGWIVLTSDPQGSFVVISGVDVISYSDRDAYEAWHREGDDSGLVGVWPWSEWGGHEWAEGLAMALDGTAVTDLAGGMAMVIVEPMPHLVVIGPDSIARYATRGHWERSEEPEAFEVF
jgi:hypothetical protein